MLYISVECQKKFQTDKNAKIILWSQEQLLTQIYAYSQEAIKYTKKVQTTQKQVGRNNEGMKNEGERVGLSEWQTKDLNKSFI